MSGSTKSSIDIAKFVFCLCIVAIHTHLFGNYYWIEQYILRLGVPFFFITSSYFLGKKLDQCQGNSDIKNIIGKYCQRLLLPLLVFSIINLIEVNIDYYYAGKSMLDIVLLNIRNILFYPYGALWFVQACIFGALFLLLFLVNKKLNIAIVLGIILYAFALLANNYYFLAEEMGFKGLIDTYNHVFISPRNGLFVGFVYLALGIKAFQIQQQIPKRATVIALAVGCVFLFVEVITLKGLSSTDDQSLYASHLLVVPAIMLLLQSCFIPLNYDFSILLRNLSTGVYFLHKPLIWIVRHFTIDVPTVYFSTVILAIIICVVIYKTKVLSLDKILK